MSIKTITNFIKKHWKPILLVVIFISLVGVLYYLQNKAKEQKLEESTLKLVATQPSESTFKSVWSVEPILFVFDSPINIDTLRFSTNPRTKVSVKSESPEAFKIVPLNGWDENQRYEISIDSLESADGSKKIYTPYKKEFMRVMPEVGDPEYPLPIRE